MRHRCSVSRHNCIRGSRRPNIVTTTTSSSHGFHSFTDTILAHLDLPSVNRHAFLHPHRPLPCPQGRG
ncbi:hypothetical protein HYQ46_005401 [Verticillium longisporum]|nr:hypothetical protein HYQ46_005401 [Verticillium longisporum]